MTIEDLVVELSKDPFNPELNFKCAVEYERINQTASAVSFYLRTAEYGVDKWVPQYVYASLLRMAACFEDQHDRQHSVSNTIMQAISFYPERPEAYFLMARFYEKAGNWQECYMQATLGTQYAELRRNSPLPVDVGYPGAYGLSFEKAVAAHWLGKRDESLEILLDLYKRDDMQPIYKKAVYDNLVRLGRAPDYIDPLEPVVMNYRKFFGASAPVIVDIGTREGDDANYLYKELNGVSVLAVDANPNAVELTKSRYPWMSVIYSAISDTDGSTIFYQVDSDNKELAGCSSMASKEKTMFPQDFVGILHEITVPMTRMDTLLKNADLMGSIDVVKIDTEGFSWQVLQGFGKRLYDVKVFHIETERDIIHDNHVLFPEITAFMKERGFVLVDIAYEWGWGIQDQVWVNPKLATRCLEYFRADV